MSMNMKQQTHWGMQSLQESALGDMHRGGNMLRWALIFFVVALVAAAFGFLGIASAAVGIARMLFYIFLILFLVSLVGGLLRRA
jgi:uncharacterized membrane protein YtjA (UPF0391 family)